MGVMSNSEHSARFRACKRFEGSIQETARIEMEEEGKVGRLTGTNITNDGRETDTDTESVAALCLVLWCALVCFVLARVTSVLRRDEGGRGTRDQRLETRDQRLETRDEKPGIVSMHGTPSASPKACVSYRGVTQIKGRDSTAPARSGALRCALEAADQRQEPTAWVGADRGCLVRYRLSPYLSRSEPRG